MSPEQKSKLIKVLIGALLAAAVAFITYLTTNLPNVLTVLPISFLSAAAVSFAL